MNSITQSKRTNKTYRFFVVFDRNASFSQTFGNADRHDGRRSIADKDGTAWIEGRVKERHGFQGCVVDLPQTPGAGWSHLAVVIVVQSSTTTRRWNVEAFQQTGASGPRATVVAVEHGPGNDVAGSRLWWWWW